jgi:hypothetical protein
VKAKEDDQVERFAGEVKDGTWLKNAQQRSQRRKSAWNLLLPLFGFPLWLTFAFFFFRLGWIAHASIHPAAHASSSEFFRGSIRLATALIIFPSLVASVFPAFLLTNFLVYQIPQARHAMEAEDRNAPIDGYGPSQRAIFKIGIVAVGVALILVVIGAALS